MHIHQVPGECWDIAKTYAHLSGTYSDANALTTPLAERFNFLVASCGDLSRYYRKKTPRLWPICIAQCMAWTLSTNEALLRGSGGAILANAMGEKYPSDRCGYCGQLPCVCAVDSRPVHQPGDCSPAQRRWSLSEWQVHLNDMYGEANRKAGVRQTINRLFEEVAEVGLILNHADGFNEPLDTVRRKIALETTDVVAWIFAAANVLEVDVEAAVRSVYERGCPICHSPTCVCRNFEKRPGMGILTHRFMPAEEIEIALAEPPH